MDIKKSVVKIKKLQKQGPNGLAVLIPKSWITSNDWNQETQLVLEFLPHQKKIIITQNEKNSDIKPE